MSAIDIASLTDDAQTLDATAFAKRHGSFFFVSLGGEMERTRVPMATQRYVPQVKSQNPETTARVTLEALAQQAAAAAKLPMTPKTAASSVLHDLVVFPVRRLATSQFPFVSIGRLEGNDVALGDPTVSKFHAYLKLDDNGAFTLLQDGRSQNGTYVDGQPVAQRHDGPPTMLVSGMNVRFGSVSLTYLDAASVMRLAKNASVTVAAFA